MIPPFDEHGNLPPGVHWATWEEFVLRYRLDGHRTTMLRRLRHVLLVFRAAGCETVYIDGSFITTAELPQDIDVVWDVRGVNFGQLDPVFLERGRRLNQRRLYSCELFPSDIIEARTNKPFIEFFQTDREGRSKGIVAIDLRGMS